MGIYLDNAATTSVFPQVSYLMDKYATRLFYNPSSVYTGGRKNRELIEKSRKTIAELINAEPEEIYFTSGGTESDNWACNEGKRRRGHIITDTIEHKAIINSLRDYPNVSYVKPDEKGVIHAGEIEKKIKKDTVMISVMMGNNEIGTIEPVDEIGNVAKNYGLIFHTDAVQAFGHMPIDVKKSAIDMMSASAHKFHGPKGCGFLYVRKGIDIMPYIAGGGQEKGKRSGTENVAGIIGMAKAAEICYANLEAWDKHLKSVNRYMTERLLKEIDGCILNGHETVRLSNNISICIKGINSRALIALLDIDGIYVSGGSACNTSHKKSYVLEEIGVRKEYIGGGIRISMDEGISLSQAEYTINRIKKHVSDLRSQ